MSFLPGLCSITFRSLPPDTLIGMAEAAGVQAIEWGSDVHVPVGGHAHARAVARRCGEAGIGCPSYGSYVRAGADDERQDFAAVLDTALDLGAANVRVWAGDEPSAGIAAGRRARVAERLHRFADQAAQRGLTVSVEYHRNTLTDTIDSALDLLLRADHPALFSYWQPEPERTLDDWRDEIRRLGARCSHLHVFHWLPGRVRRPLAEGAVYWPTLLSDLEAGGATARCAFLEHVMDDDPARFASDFRVLKTLCGEVAADNKKKGIA